MLKSRLWIGVVLLSGCSLASIEEAPADYRSRVLFRCTSNNVAPGLDLLWAVGASATAVAAGADGQAGPAVVSGLVAALTAGSSIYGFSSTASCRRALDYAYARLDGRLGGGVETHRTSYRPRA